MSNKSGLPDSGPAQQADPNGWLGTETLQTRFGDFQFKDGYPLGDAAQRLLDLQKLNRSPTYSVTLGLRGFQVEGKTDQAIRLMKQIEIYPLDKAAAPPAMQFMNGSKQSIETVFPDSFRFFELLAMLVEEEPLELHVVRTVSDAGDRHREGKTA